MGNAFRMSQGLGLGLTLLLTGPAAFATFDMSVDGRADIRDASPGDNVSTIVNGGDVDGSSWMSDGTHAHRPTIFRELPFRRVTTSSSGTTVSDDPPADPPAVPEPSTAIAAGLLLLPLGASALHSVRKRKMHLTAA